MRAIGSKVLAICNTQGASFICVKSDAAPYTHAGRKLAVASTKAFVAQITAAYVLGLYLAYVTYVLILKSLIRWIPLNTPRKVQWILDTQTETVHDAAAQMVDAKSFLFPGVMLATRSRWKVR